MNKPITGHSVIVMVLSTNAKNFTVMSTATQLTLVLLHAGLVQKFFFFLDFFRGGGGGRLSSFWASRVGAHSKVGG